MTGPYHIPAAAVQMASPRARRPGFGNLGLRLNKNAAPAIATNITIPTNPLAMTATPVIAQAAIHKASDARPRLIVERSRSNSDAVIAQASGISVTAARPNPMKIGLVRRTTALRNPTLLLVALLTA